jgi:hypothetical protein
MLGRGEFPAAMTPRLALAGHFCVNKKVGHVEGRGDLTPTHCENKVNSLGG